LSFRKETAVKLITGTYEHTIVDGGKPYTITHGTYHITPADAQRLLDTNSNNRSKNSAAISKMERAHLQGNWKYTGDVIQLDHRGVLMNGQHRLTAAVNTGQALEIAVDTGFPTDFFYFMDISKPRSTNDAFGIYGVKNPTNASKVVTLLWQMANGQYPGWKTGGQAPAPPEAVDLFFSFGPVGTNTLDPHIARGAKARLTHLHPGAVGVLSYLYSRVDSELNELFWEGVIEGLNITTATDARKALTDFVDRQWEARESGVQGFRPGQCARWIHFAWNKWMAGKQIRKSGFQVEKIESELEREMSQMATVAVQERQSRGKKAA
jgi:hypothetical protein